MSREIERPLRDCPEDGVILAFLDQALVRERAEAVKGHLAGCAPCGARVEQIARRDEMVRAWIRRHDPPPPSMEAYDLGRPARRGVGSRRWAAAAAVVILAGALSVPAVGWVVDRIQRFADEARSSQVVDEGIDAPVSHAISFPAAGSHLEIRFESASTRGTLVLERTADPLVLFDAWNADVALTVSPGRIQVGNLVVPEGHYRLRVPEGLEHLTVVVQGSVPMEIELPADEGFLLEVDLGRGGPVPR